MKTKILTAFLAVTAAACCSFGLAACNNGNLSDSGVNDVPGNVEDFDVSGDPDYVGNSDRGKGLLFELNADNTYTVTGQNPETATADITVPETYNDLPVTAIAAQAFTGAEIASVYISASIKSVGANAFSSCGNLVSVLVSPSVEQIGARAFSNCKSLRAVIFSGESALGSIDESVFESCESLVNFTVPDSVVSIGKQAFQGCTSLKSVNIGDGVKDIGERAFYRCTSLGEVNFGSSLKTIGDSSFEECTAIKSIAVPDSVDSFGEKVFYHCKSLEKLTVPFIGAAREFANIPKPEAQADDGEEGEEGGESGGQESGSVEKTHLGYLFGAPTHYDNDQTNGDYVPQTLEYVNVTGGERIAELAFSYCRNIKTIILGDSIQRIEFNAFGECGVENLVLGTGLERIATAIMGNRAVYDPSASDTIPLYIYYKGTAADWGNIVKETNPDNPYENNQAFDSAPRYYYSETEKDSEHWRFVDGMPVVY